MQAVPDPRRRTAPTAASIKGAETGAPVGNAPGTAPGTAVSRLLEILGIGAVAGGGLAGAMLLIHSPFDGPWRVVLAVAVVFAGIYAGFLMIGFAANLRELEAVRRCLALVARRQRQHEP